MKSGRGWWALAGFGVLTLLGLYVGAYYANATATGTLWLGGSQRDMKYCVVPRYRVCDKASRTIFSPVYAIDRRLRPGIWTAPLRPDEFLPEDSE